MSNNYSNYLGDSQYYDQKSAITDLNNNQLSGSNYALSYDLNKQNDLNRSPVNYYHENYSDLFNNTHLLVNNSPSNKNSFYFNNSNLNNQSRRLFHRNSIICSSMKDKYGTLNGQNIVPVQRSIDHIEDLIANKTLFQADLSAALSTASTNSPSIYSNLNSSERNMITNSSSYDEQENYSLYNSTLSPNPSNQSRQHSLAIRDSLISSNETAQFRKLKQIYKNGRFANPFDTWKDRTIFGTIKFLLSPANINLPRNKKDLDITLPVIKPILSSIVPKDKLRVIWFGHATVMVQFENATILTDPQFSQYAHPLKLGVRRYRPLPATIEELPDNLNIVCISHNHYDHLDYDSVMKLNKRFKKQLNWFVPLGMKEWFTKLDIDNVVELNWWEEYVMSDLNDLRIVATPAQHWSRRGLFDENKELWSSFSIIGKQFRFFFAGDTGYNEQLFRTIGKEFGPFHISAIPIGAYEPNNFLRYQHVNPKEAVLIHKNIRSYCSAAIHWGTFPLSNEWYLEPPQKLRIAMDQTNVTKDQFLIFEHGETRLINLDGTSKRENINRYAK